MGKDVFSRKRLLNLQGGLIRSSKAQSLEEVE